MSNRDHSGASVEIVRFRPEHRTEARRLILAGLEEHWGALDPGLNSDVDDIGATYARGTALVARRADRVVGVGVVVPVAPEEGEVLRMSVARDLRRQGIATALLRELVAVAEQRGWRRVRLETTASWRDAVSFYAAFGFTLTHHEEGRFGRNACFALDLRAR